MINKIILPIVFVATGIFPSYSQAPSEDIIESTLLEASNVTIEGEKRINDLEKRYIKMNSESLKMNGYRIQLFSSSGAESWAKSNEVQTEFLKIYPDIPAHVVHIKPSFKVRVGDFRTRMDAERFYVVKRKLS